MAGISSYFLWYSTWFRVVVLFGKYHTRSSSYCSYYSRYLEAYLAVSSFIHPFSARRCSYLSFDFIFSPLSSSLSFFFFISFSSSFVLLSLHLSSLLVFDSITVPIRTLLRRLSCSAALMNIVKPSNCIRIQFDLPNRIAVRSNNYPVITNSYWYQ